MVVWPNLRAKRPSSSSHMNLQVFIRRHRNNAGIVQMGSHKCCIVYSLFNRRHEGAHPNEYKSTHNVALLRAKANAASELAIRR